MLANRNSPTVVDYLAAIVVQEGDIDGCAVSGHRLVHRVIDDLPDEVVEPGWAGRSDVHTGPLPDGLETFQNRDVGGAVGGLRAHLRDPFTGVLPYGIPLVKKPVNVVQNRRSEGKFTTLLAYQPGQD